MSGGVGGMGATAGRRCQPRGRHSCRGKYICLNVWASDCRMKMSFGKPDNRAGDRTRQPHQPLISYDRLSSCLCFRSLPTQAAGEVRDNGRGNDEASTSQAGGSEAAQQYVEASDASDEEDEGLGEFHTAASVRGKRAVGECMADQAASGAGELGATGW
eukprot:scaffold446845_cov29-Prasinocladus_malaysianus.AAC.1